MVNALMQTSLSIILFQFVPSGDIQLLPSMIGSA